METVKNNKWMINAQYLRNSTFIKLMVYFHQKTKTFLNISRKYCDSFFIRKYVHTVVNAELYICIWYNGVIMLPSRRDKSHPADLNFFIMLDIKLATKYIVQTYSVKIAVFSNLKQAWILELTLNGRSCQQEHQS